MKKLILTFAAMVAMTGVTFAQEPKCIDVQSLGKAAKEMHYMPQAIGRVAVEGGNVAMIMFAGPKGEWEIYMIGPKGTACQIAAGTEFQSANSAAADDSDKGI